MFLCTARLYKHNNVKNLALQSTFKDDTIVNLYDLITEKMISSNVEDVGHFGITKHMVINISQAFHTACHLQI